MADLEIAPDDIRALGAIYFAAMLEQLKVFEVADRLLELYLDGLLPISRPGAGHALNTYWREERERVSEAERQGLYAVAFGMPGGDAGTTPNRDFSALWIRFAAGVEAFAREPTGDGDMGTNTPHPIHQEQVRRTARDLAVNLILSGASVVRMAPAISRQLDVLIQVLSDGEIQRAYGARNMWEVVDTVSSLELGGSASGVRYRELAESGAIVFAWLASRAPALANTSGDILNPADILGERHSDSPATNPTDYDLVNAWERWLSASIDEPRIENLAEPVETAEARDAVHSLLSRNAAFARLAPPLQRRVARDTARIADYLLSPGPDEAFTDVVESVNFPAFVADLIEGVFGAIVGASINQMEAYADLVTAVAASVGEFKDPGMSDIHVRERLCERYPALCPPADDEGQTHAQSLDAIAAGAWRRRATTRQQLLATMVLLGVARVASSDR